MCKDIGIPVYLCMYVLCLSHVGIYYVQQITLVDGCLCTYLLILLYCSLFFTVFTFWHWQVADDVGGPLSLVSDLYSLNTLLLVIETIYMCIIVHVCMCIYT